MKIWGEVPKVASVYGNTKRPEKIAGTKEVAAKRDELTISAPAKDFQTVMKAVRALPDVREEKVTEIGAKMEAGTYKVEAKDVSAKIIASLMAKRV